MELFDIAGLKVAFDCPEGMLRDRSRPYLSEIQDDSLADFKLHIPEDVLDEKSKLYPQLNRDECRYVFLGEAFYHKLLNYDGMLLHASAIEKDGEAYLFSAPSGTGKSTHTHLWFENFKNVRMINDDKPAIRKIDGKYYACGTPFSGKNDESNNINVPIKAIVFLERAKENSIKFLEPKQAVTQMLAQTVRPLKTDGVVKLLDMIDGVLKEIPVFKLYCNISKEAVETSYNGILNYYNGEKI